VPIRNQSTADTLDMRKPERSAITFEVYDAHSVVSLEAGVLATVDGDIYGPQETYDHSESQALSRHVPMNNYNGSEIFERL